MDFHKVRDVWARVQHIVATGSETSGSTLPELNVTASAIHWPVKGGATGKYVNLVV